MASSLLEVKKPSFGVLHGLPGWVKIKSSMYVCQQSLASLRVPSSSNLKSEYQRVAANLKRIKLTQERRMKEIRADVIEPLS